MIECNYYEQLDCLFNKLYEKYGLEEDIISIKNDIIKIIDNLIDYDYKYSNDITSQLKKRNYKIDENGFIVSC
jgi:hypothetical protein